MKKFLFCLIASFAFYGSAIADNDLPENLPPAEVQAAPITPAKASINAFWGNAIAGDDLPGNPPPEEVQAPPITPSKALLKAPLSNNNQLVKVQVSNNKGVVLYQVITSSSSISIDAKYLQTDVYTINIMPVLN